MLIFIDMPRTGGAGLTAMLKSYYPRSFQLSQREDYRSFFSLPVAQRNTFDMLTGHMPFGLHRWTDMSCRYVVWLRDPIDRIASNYFQARAEPGSATHDLAMRVTLSEYLAQAPSLMNDNGQVRRLATYDLDEVLGDGKFWWQRVPVGGVTDDMLHQAKDNLARTFVGIYERFPDDVERMCDTLGLPRTPAPQLDGAVRDGVDPKTRELIRRNNNFDYLLYDYACRLRAVQCAGRGDLGATTENTIVP